MPHWNPPVRPLSSPAHNRPPLLQLLSSRLVTMPRRASPPLRAERRARYLAVVAAARRRHTAAARLALARRRHAAAARLAAAVAVVAAPRLALVTIYLSVLRP